MKRILFLSWLLVALSVQAAGKQSRPNILFAFADDWGRYASAYAKVDGRTSPNDVIKTSHFDSVAREELFILNDGPDHLKNVASEAKYAAIKKKLNAQLMAELKRTNACV